MPITLYRKNLKLSSILWNILLNIIESGNVYNLQRLVNLTCKKYVLKQDVKLTQIVQFF